MIRVALLGCDSTHTEAYGGLISNEYAALGSRAKAISIWGAEPDAVKTKATLLGIDRVEDTVQAAIKDIDAIMIVNRFGEDRFQLGMQALVVGKPVFADKPLTMDMQEAKQLTEAFANNNVPLFSSSAFRFAEEVQQLRKRLQNKTVIGGVVTGPFECTNLGDDPRLKKIFFYGIHLTEMLQEVFGARFDSVTVSTSPEHGYLAQVRTRDGLQINLAMMKPMKDYYSVTAFTSEKRFGFTLNLEGEYYTHTLSTFLDFVEGKHPGVPLEHTLEALELLFAIEKSAQTGKSVQMEGICA